MDDLKLDPDSPIPIYHQIAEVIRYQLATGRILPGARLPSAREASVRWGVHFHTVRRAYAELADLGLVSIQGARGTIVMRRQREQVSPRVTAFVTRVIEEANGFGLSPNQVASLVLNRPVGSADSDSGTITVVECNPVQARELAEQVRGAFSVRAEPSCLTDGEPPPGPVLATYFHYAEIARRWRDRLASVHFASIRPDPRLRDELDSRWRRVRSRRIGLLEYDRSMAKNMAQDLAEVLPADRYAITPRSAKDPVTVLRRLPANTPILVAPRVWSDLPESWTRDRRLIEVRYAFDVRELAAIAEHLRWKPRTPGVPAAESAVCLKG